MRLSKGYDPDHDLIMRAKKGDKMAIDALFKKYRRLMDYKAGAFRKSSMPFPAIQAEAYKLFMAALKKYDPKSNVLFKTFLESQLRLHRYVHQHKNIVRIPENKLLNIKRFQTTKSALENMYGREPTPTELADHLGWRMSQVESMENTLKRKTYSMSESKERKFGLEAKDQGARFKETKEYVYYTLNPLEQHVFDYSEGAHGKRRLNAQAIAKKLNISLDKVYRIRRKIDSKLFGYF